MRHAFCIQIWRKKHLQQKGVIILLESEKKNVGHFVCVTNGKEYFSSYGHDPRYALKLTGNSDKLLKFLPRNYDYNKVKFQNERNANTCALYCLARVILVDMTLREFQKLFRRKINLKNSDEVITLATLLLRSQM